MGYPISELLLSGVFGNYLSIRSARRDLPPSRVRYVAKCPPVWARKTGTTLGDRA